MSLIKEVKSFEDFKVKIVTSFPDLYVFVTKNKNEAKEKDEIWFFDNNFVDKKIKFVTSFEDLKIQLNIPEQIEPTVRLNDTVIPV
jgi:hypothetical protein